MVRVDADSGLGVAVSTDCNGRFAKLDPYAGAQLALAESYRNVATSGARPLAVSDCLNFGSPEDPDVMWQFAEATRGLADGCQALGIPVTGGNVSLYNQTGETAILPTPVVAVLGVIDDVARRTPSGFVAEGQQIYLLGATARRAVRLGVGARRARPPRRAAAAGRPGGREGARRHPGQRLARRARRRRARPVRRRPGPGAGRVLPAQRRRRPGLAARRRSTRSSRCSASPPAGRSWRCRARRRSGSPTCAAPAASREPDLLAARDRDDRAAGRLAEQRDERVEAVRQPHPGARRRGAGRTRPAPGRGRRRTGRARRRPGRRARR